MAQHTDDRFISVLMEHGPSSRAHIARMTAISKPTISESAARLLKAGVIVHLGKHACKQGRPVQLYDLNANYGHAVGISIERGHVAVRALDFTGAVVHEDRFDTETNDSVPDALARAGEMLQRVDAAVEHPRLATAVAVAAPIDPKSSKIIGWPNSPFPDGVDILSQALHIAGDHPLVVDNDVNWATLAEHGIGSMRDADDFMYVYLGAGVGAGLFLGGRVHRGSRGLAGEIAFTRLASGELFIHKLANSVIGTHDGWGGSIDTTRAVSLFNDAAHQEILQPVIEDISWVIANVATSIDPGQIVIGGPLSEAAPLIDAVRRHLQLPSGADVPVVASPLGKNAPLYGAALGALELARRKCTSRNSLHPLHPVALTPRLL